MMGNMRWKSVRNGLYILSALFSMHCAQEGSENPQSAEGESVNGFDGVAELPTGVTMEFVWIAPGSFVMGSPEGEVGRQADEGPQHRVTISQGFYLGKYEVTQEQWLAVMESVPWLGEDFIQLSSLHPAVYVSWHDTQAFVQKLNADAGDSLYRLPTEAEWEYAARAGSQKRWSFGDDEGRLGEYAWYRANAWDQGLRYAQPVGSKAPNPWGLHDMHGNVWEWCQDVYGPYTSADQVDPQGAALGANRAVRGGPFNGRPREVRAADRSGSGPGYRRNYNIGYRLVRIK